MTQPITNLNDMPGDPAVNGNSVHGNSAGEGSNEMSPSSETDSNVPNRKRRTYFVFTSMFMAWLSSLVLTHFGTGMIAERVADSLMLYLHIMGPTYVFGHSVDRSEILSRLGARPTIGS